MLAAFYITYCTLRHTRQLFKLALCNVHLIPYLFKMCNYHSATHFIKDFYIVNEIPICRYYIVTVHKSAHVILCILLINNYTRLKKYNLSKKGAIYVGSKDKGITAIITLLISGAFLILPFIVIDWPSVFVPIIIAILIFVLGDFLGNLVLTGTFIWGFIEIINKPLSFLSVLYYIVFAVFIIYYIIKIVAFISEMRNPY